MSLQRTEIFVNNGLCISLWITLELWITVAFRRVAHRMSTGSPLQIRAKSFAKGVAVILKMCDIVGMDTATHRIEQAHRLMKHADKCEHRGMHGAARVLRRQAQRASAAGLVEALDPKPAPPVDTDQRIDAILTGLRAGL